MKKFLLLAAMLSAFSACIQADDQVTIDPLITDQSSAEQSAEVKSKEANAGADASVDDTPLPVPADSADAGQDLAVDSEVAPREQVAGQVTEDAETETADKNEVVQETLSDVKQTNTDNLSAPSPAVVQTEASGGAAASEISQRLQTYLERTNSLRAEFESILLDSEYRQVAVSTGQVYIKKPGKFRWEYESPSPSLVLADGEILWSYDEELEQAVARKLSDYRGANPTMLLGGEAEITDSFDIQASYAGEEIDWLELSPKDQTSDFVKVRLGFKADVIVLMELVDKLEQVTRIRFINVRTNVELANELFEFEPPDHVDVVNGSGSG